MASAGHSDLHTPQAMQAFPIIYANRTTSFTSLVIANPQPLASATAVMLRYLFATLSSESFFLQ